MHKKLCFYLCLTKSHSVLKDKIDFIQFQLEKESIKAESILVCPWKRPEYSFLSRICPDPIFTPTKEINSLQSKVKQRIIASRTTRQYTNPEPAPQTAF